LLISASFQRDVHFSTKRHSEQTRAFHARYVIGGYVDVLKVSAADFQRNIGRYQDIALRQPVAITRNGRESCMLLSTEEYNRLKRRDRQVFSTADAPEEIIEAVRNATMDPRHDHLDELLKDWTP
jgi:PHD/YefM family antitoxin component YafN of YafNO toxin-antitoxin module